MIKGRFAIPIPSQVIIEGFKSYKDQTSTELFSNNINVVGMPYACKRNSIRSALQCVCARGTPAPAGGPHVAEVDRAGLLILAAMPPLQPPPHVRTLASGSEWRWKVKLLPW